MAEAGPEDEPLLPEPESALFEPVASWPQDEEAETATAPPLAVDTAADDLGEEE